MTKNAETTISFNTQSDIKTRLQDMARENGLTISDLMRMSAMQILNKGIRIEPTYEPARYLRNAINEAEHDLADSKLTTVSKSKELSSYLQNLKR